MRLLVGAGAAAGLATTFNAPIAGGVFILEELLRRFDPRTVLATLFASCCGFAAARVAFGGRATDFHMAPLAAPSVSESGWVLLVGLVAGVVGVFYNRAILGSLNLVDRFRLPREPRAAVVGALVGAVAFYAPDMVGGGEELTQRALLGHGALGAVVVVLLVRSVLGVLSYAAGTPGGLFAPMLVLGSHLGLLVALLANDVPGHSALNGPAMALIGMAALFASTVQAPVTGIVLATELTGISSQLPAMLGAAAMAMLVAMVLKELPIYDALANRAAAKSAQPAVDA